MFNILLDKNVPYCIIRLLLDAYERQEARVMWKTCNSEYFKLQNGVKQGGVISPTLFNLYIDRLLLKLKKSGIGCNMNGVYMGALSYADDITITSPSLQGLNIMLGICDDFAQSNFITFNSKKTICIKYGEPVRNTEHVKLNGVTLLWQTEVRHLGNYFNSKLDNTMDSLRKCSHFIGYFNKLMVNFGHLHPDTVCNLFKSYCCSFYGSFIWKYCSDGFNKCCIQWNKSIRKIYSLPYATHTKLLGPLVCQDHISSQLIRRDIKFMHRLLDCSNVIIKQCFHNAYYNSNTLIGYKLAYYRARFGFNLFSSVLSKSLGRAKPPHIGIELQARVNCLRTLCLAKSNHATIDNFTMEDINDIINAIALD